MSAYHYVALTCVFVVAASLTAAWRAISMRYAMLDVPNVRSSHSVPTPRGAGVAIIVAFLPVPVMLYTSGVEDWRLVFALVAGGLLVGLAGVADDYRSLAPIWRLIIQVVAALLAFAAIGAPPELLRYSTLSFWPWCVAAVTVVAIVWHVNLYNFMDGIDGIAGGQAIFVAGAGAYLSWTLGDASSSFVFLCLAASCAGFLLWNWPRAKVFMGDAGSGFLGFALAVFALYSASATRATVWTWVILMSAFIVDATVTFIRRALRGEKVYEAHRSHAYQWSSRRWKSHAKVTVAFLAIDVLWLLPFAWASVAYAEHAPLLTLAATGPLVVLAWLLGAGKAED